MTLIIYKDKKLYADRFSACGDRYKENIKKIKPINNGYYTGAGETRVIDFVFEKLNDFAAEKRTKKELVLFFTYLQKDITDVGFNSETTINRIKVG